LSRLDDPLPRTSRPATPPAPFSIALRHPWTRPHPAPAQVPLHEISTECVFPWTRPHPAPAQVPLHEISTECVFLEATLTTRKPPTAIQPSSRSNASRQ
jgi:hypothetical protein